MAFPVVETVATTANGTVSTSTTVTLPASIAANDWLVGFGRIGATGSITFPGGWTQIASSQADASNDRQTMDVMLAAGTETGTIEVTHGNAKSSFILLRISGGDPAITPEISADAIGTSTTPDPASLTPTGGAKDYLWLWCGGWEGEQTSPPAGNPTNYTVVADEDSGTGGAITTNVRLAVARRDLNAVSEDPPSWTIDASDDWTAWTVAVHPAAAVTAISFDVGQIAF